MLQRNNEKLREQIKHDRENEIPPQKVMDNKNFRITSSDVQKFNDMLTEQGFKFKSESENIQIITQNDEDVKEEIMFFANLLQVDNIDEETIKKINSTLRILIDKYIYPKITFLSVK